MSPINVSEPVRVVIPTVYRFECPTVRSRLFPLCRELASSGFNFTFLVIGKGEEEIAPGIFCSGYRNYFELVRRVITISRNDADIIFPCKAYTITGLLSLIIARIRNLGYLLDVDDRTFPSEVNKWWRLPLYIQEWCSEKLLKILEVPTTVASQALYEHMGSHAVYIPNSADTEKFSKGKWDSAFIEKQFGINGPVVIWPAVFFQETDRKYVFEIFAALNKRHSGLKLLLIGEGEYLPYMKSRAAELGLTNVFFSGAVDYNDIPNFYASAIAGLLPLRNNHYDACKGPIKLFEYMAMELPVIATEIGEPMEFVSKAACGILLPFDDPEHAANLIMELVQSSDDLESCGKNGRRFLEDRNNFACNAMQLKELLLNAVRH